MLYDDADLNMTDTWNGGRRRDRGSRGARQALTAFEMRRMSPETRAKAPGRSSKMSQRGDGDSEMRTTALSGREGRPERLRRFNAVFTRAQPETVLDVDGSDGGCTKRDSEVVAIAVGQEPMQLLAPILASSQAVARNTSLICADDGDWRGIAVTICA